MGRTAPAIGERFNPRKLFEVIIIADPIARYKGISPGAKLVWGRLFRFSGNCGEIYPAIKTVADDLGMSESQCRRYLHELVDTGFLESAPNPGYTNNYFFIWHSAYEGEVGETRMLPPLSDATGVPDAEPLSDATGPTPVGCYTTPLSDATGERTDLRTDYLRTEEIPPTPSFSEEEKLQTQTPTSAPPAACDEKYSTEQSDLQLEDDVLAFVENVYSRERRIRFKKPEQRKHEALIRSRESELGAHEFRTGLICYLKSSNDKLKERKWPISWYLADPYRNIPQQGQTPTASASPRPEAGSVSSDASANAPARFEQPEEKRNPLLTYVDTWNTIVFDKPVDDVPEYTMRNLEKWAKKADFQKYFVQVCEMCQRINSGGKHECTFDWILEGFVPGWQKVHAGLYKWALPKADPMDELIAKAEREEREAAQQ